MEVDVLSETDQHIAWPGQALAYKVSQLKLLKLRDRSARKLRGAFVLSRFHDEGPGAGSLPLDVLQKRIDAWFAREAIRFEP